MAVKTSALSSTVRPFRARATRGAAPPRGRLRVRELPLGARLRRRRLRRWNGARGAPQERAQAGTPAPTAQALAGQHVALLFDKPSLRTRATFEIAVHELGGDVIVPPQEGPLGARETVADVAGTSSAGCRAAVVRTYGQDRVIELAEAARRPRHQRPHQRGASVPGGRRLLTLHERWGGLGRAARGRTIAYVGDGNNVATSLVQAALLSGVSVRGDAEGRRAVR